MILYRLVSKQYGATIANAFSGEGAKLNGQRWNSRGTPLVYTASSTEVAIVEMMGHNVPFFTLKGKYHFFSLELADDLIERLSPLPPGWRDYPSSRVSAEAGDQWVRSLRSPGLLVPSAVLPNHYNCLLNPLFPDYRGLVLGAISGPFPVIEAHITGPEYLT
jgi:RES domain-containing protein